MKTKKSTPFLTMNYNEGEPEVSPDGRWLAFVADTTGNSEVYVQNLANGSDRIRISAAGGRNPRWRHDGGELFFIAPAGSVISTTQRSPGRWDNPSLAELFRLPANVRGFAVSPDGRSFLISSTTPGAGDSLFHVVLGE